MLQLLKNENQTQISQLKVRNLLNSSKHAVRSTSLPEKTNILKHHFQLNRTTFTENPEKILQIWVENLTKHNFSWSNLKTKLKYHNWKSEIYSIPTNMPCEARPYLKTKHSQTSFPPQSTQILRKSWQHLANLSWNSNKQHFQQSKSAKITAI